MVKPTVHLNGTGRDSLLTAYCEAGNALRHALEALGVASPNGRDYYPQGDEATRIAINEHVLRINAVRAVYEDMQALAEHVADCD